MDVAKLDSTVELPRKNGLHATSLCATASGGSRAAAATEEAVLNGARRWLFQGEIAANVVKTC